MRAASETKFSLLEGHPFEKCVIHWKWDVINDHLRHDGPFAIDAAKLHQFLGVQHEFRNWFTNIVQVWGYTDGDFYPMHAKHLKKRTNYVLTLSMAQQIVVLNGGAKGREARKYIVELKKAEDQWWHLLLRTRGVLLQPVPTHDDWLSGKLRAYQEMKKSTRVSP